MSKNVIKESSKYTAIKEVAFFFIYCQKSVFISQVGCQDIFFAKANQIVENSDFKRDICWKCSSKMVLIFFTGEWIQNLFGVLHKLWQCGSVPETKTEKEKRSGEFTQCKFVIFKVFLCYCVGSYCLSWVM